jgi:hypothetical protein
MISTDKIYVGVANLFEKDENEAFYFTEIKKCFHHDRNKTAITFCYSYCNDRFMDSSLLVDGVVPDNLEHTLFSIGMCVLPFYWMAFGCGRIIIEKEVYSGSADILPFWQMLYSNVLLEYLYHNKGAEAPVLELACTPEDCSRCPEPLRFCSDIEGRGHTLIPIGCKLNSTCMHSCELWHAVL